MIFSIITPYSTKHFTIAWLEIVAYQSNMTIQPGHAPIIVKLSPSEKIIFMLESGTKEELHLNHAGFLEVQRDSIVALINQE